MKTYLLINQSGEGIGIVEIQGSRVKPGVSSREAVELRTTLDEIREKVRKNPHYFYIKNGLLTEMTSVEKVIKDNAAKKSIQRFRKKT